MQLNSLAVTWLDLSLYKVLCLCHLQQCDEGAEYINETFRSVSGT